MMHKSDERVGEWGLVKIVVPARQHYNRNRDIYILPPQNAMYGEFFVPNKTDVNKSSFIVCQYKRNKLTIET